MVVIGVVDDGRLKKTILEKRIKFSKDLDRMPSVSEVTKAYLIEGLKTGDDKIIKGLRK